MRYFKLLLFLVFALNSFTSCKKNSIPAIAKFIPENSKIVASINVKTLQSKGAFDSLESIQDGQLQEIIQLLSQKDGNGIDFSTPIFIFQNINNKYFFVLKLSDVSKFESSLTMLKQESKNFHYAYNQNLNLAWTKDVLFIQNSKSVSSLNFISSIDSLINHTSKFKNITENDDFVSDYNNHKDLFAWLNTSESYQELISQSATQNPLNLSLFLKKEMFEHSGFSFNFQFDKGVVNIEIKNHNSPLISSAIKDSKTIKFDGSMLNSMSIQDYNMIGGLNVNFPLIKSLLDKLGYLTALEMMLSQKKMTMESFTNALNGNVSFVANMQNQKSQIIVKLGIKDPKAFENLIALITENKATLQNGQLQFAPEILLKVENNFANIFINTLPNEENDKAMNLDKQVMSRFEESIGGVFFDIAKLKNYQDTLDNNNLSNYVENSTFWFSEFKAQKGTSRMEMNMLNKNKNSLNSILKIITNPNSDSIFQNQQLATIDTLNVH